MTQLDQYVVIGKLGAAFGVKGWVKVHSFTHPITNIMRYHPWYVCQNGAWRQREVSHIKPHGKGLVAQFHGVSDRNSAEELIGCELAVLRSALPPSEEGEYYWADLQGLSVRNLQGQSLGKVKSLMATGANDVLVVKGERTRLIPYVSDQIVKSVDLQQNLIIVDWAPDY